MILEKFEGKNENISLAVDFIKSSFEKEKAKKEDITRTMLLAEEIIATMLEGENAPKEFAVKIYKSLTIPTVRIEAKGDCLDAEFISSQLGDFELEDIDSPSALSAIRNMILGAGKEKLELKKKNGHTYVKITAGEPSKKRLMVTIYSLILGILAGILLRVILPTAAETALDGYVLSPIKTIFLNLLKMVMAPLIFFSIASCIGTITDFSEIGKIGAKIMGFYMFTSFIAIGVGFLCYYAFARVGFNDFAYMVTGAVAEESAGVNFIDTIIAIFPSNFFGSFVDSDTLKIIVLALLTGYATTKLGNRSQKVADFLDTANELFGTITTVITNFVFIMVFAAMCSMALTIDVTSLKSEISLFVAIVIGLFMMIALYMLLCGLLGHENPFGFMKKILPAWLNAFSLSSSSASMPFTMKTCDTALGVLPKVFSFSIPLGATINMDGSTVILTTATLFFAKAFGVTLRPGDIVILIFSTILLTMGAPGIPGASLMCQSVLLAMFNIPIEALAIFVTLNAILDPVLTADNVLGDITGTYIVAKRSGNVRQKDR